MIYSVALCEGIIRVMCMQACMAQLWARDVDLEAVLLKPMMVMAGGDAPQKTAPVEVARLTLDVMRRHIARLHCLQITVPVQYA